MTTAPFERLLYTDCRPGDGRGAGGGFQVQAQSAGVDSAQAALAVGSLLYEVQEAWVVQRRPVGDFPAGFAHTSGPGGYGTAQGRYVGKEATGGRQGNHLTDCLLTRTPAPYGTIRPAQLWRSPFWREVPWESTDCPVFDGDLEPGPLTLEAVTDWVRDRPERGPILASLLSVLEDPAGDHVVITASEAHEAMAWIAAATLLLPERRALDVSFKVFSTSPLRAGQRVVAAPATLNPQLAPGNTGGAFLLDAVGCTADDAACSERAAFLVGKLTGGTDPYDLIDAIELAEELSGSEWPADIAALHTAWALTLPDEPKAEPETLFRWLTSAKPEQHKAHGTAVGEVLLDAAPTADMLRWLDAALPGQLDLDRDRVRGMLLDAELAEIHGGRPIPADKLAQAPLSEQSRRDAASKLSSAILLSSGESSQGRIDVNQIDLVLRLTRRHGVSLEPSPLGAQLHGLATAWVDHPRTWDPAGWALRDYIIDLTCDELRDRLVKRDPQAMLDPLRAFAQLLGNRITDPADPLYWHLQAAAIDRLSRGQRHARVGDLLEQIRQLGQPGTSVAVASMQRTLLLWGVVDADMAVTFLTTLPAAELNPEIARYAGDFLARSEPTAELLDVLASLDKAGRRPASQRLTALIDADHAVGDFIARAASEKGNSAGKIVELLCRADPAVVIIRRDAIMTALFKAPRPQLAAKVLADFPVTHMGSKRPRPVDALIEVVRAGLNRSTTTFEEAVSTAAWCMCVLSYPELLEKRANRHAKLADVIRDYGNALDPKDFKTWGAEVTRHLDQESRYEWDQIFGDGAKRGGGIKQGINLWRGV
jgi:hypothetical protein